MDLELNKKIAELAIEYAEQKVPYIHRGMSRRGCDCTGLIIAVCKELGYWKNFKLRQYPPDWNLHAGAGNQVVEELSKYAVEIDNRRASIGDIAIMRFGRCPAHCGIIISSDLVMVHSLKSNGHVKKSLLKNSLWRNRWIKTFRLMEDKLD